VANLETGIYFGVKRAQKARETTPEGNYDEVNVPSGHFSLVDPKEHTSGFLINGSGG
jgi:hypothetical protein